MNYYALGAEASLRRLGLAKFASVPTRLPTALLPNPQRAQRLKQLLAKAPAEMPTGFGTVPQESPGMFAAFEPKPAAKFNPKTTMRGVPADFELPAIRPLPGVE